MIFVAGYGDAIHILVVEIQFRKSHVIIYRRLIGPKHKTYTLEFKFKLIVDSKIEGFHSRNVVSFESTLKTMRGRLLQPNHDITILLLLTTIRLYTFDRMFY